jgi:hypothetical protein
MSDKILKGNRMYALVALIIGIIVVSGFLYFNQQPKKPKTFYVVAYHWGYAIYDENLNEISKISVNKGDLVKIVLLPAEAFSHEFHESLVQRTIERGIGDLPPGSSEIVEKLDEAEEKGLLNHGFSILGYDVDIVTDYTQFSGSAGSLDELLKVEKSSAIQRHTITFRADKPGSYDIICSKFCGYGHGWMIIPGGFTVSG